MKKVNKRIVLSLLLLLIVAGPAGAASFSDKIKGIIASKTNQKVHFSICFRDVAAGTTVFESNADRPQKPASNMKLLTTAAALDVLGPEFCYETIYGMLGNDLVVVASGDPLLGDPVVAARKGQDIFGIFGQLAGALKSQNITVIAGNLLIDDYIFDEERFHPSWPVAQENNWYTAQVAGLNFNDNCVDMLFSPGAAAGQPARFVCTPDTRFLTIVNNCKTVSSRQKTAVGAVRKHNSNDVTLIGSCGISLVEPVNVTVDNPSAYHGFVLAEFLKQQGIEIKGELIIRQVVDNEGGMPAGFKPLMTIKTPIVDVLIESNQRSLNLVAECLMKTTGAWAGSARRTGRPGTQGSWEHGRQAVSAIMKKAGVSMEGLVIDDGSGLSHKNQISARAMSTLLAYMSRRPYAQLYKDSLATADHGTLSKRDRFSEEKYADKVSAKTGYITGANTLSGYCNTLSGKALTFSILTENPSASNYTIDQIVKIIIDNY